MASGVGLKSLERFAKNYQDFKDMVLNESRVAIAKTREDFLLTVADMLGSVDGEAGGTTNVIPSDYAVVWEKLSKKWLAWKEKNGLQTEIGVAHGSKQPGLKAYLLSISGTAQDVKRAKDEAFLFWRIDRPSSSGAQDKKSALDPFAKLYYLEYGEVSENLPARPVWYPVLRWYQARAGMQDELIRAPYVAALRRAKAIIYGG